MSVRAPTAEGTTRPRLRVEEGLHRGLRNRWYPILRARDLDTAPLGIRRLGEDLVLWRDGQGRPHLLPDRCPHRGARLSLGHVHGEVLACGYHGFEFAGSGECTSVPVEGAESRLITRLTLPSYPVEERWGLIWAYIGELDLFPAPPLRLPEELTDAAWSGFLCTAEWPVNWLIVYDNQADPMHGPFLHAKSYTLSRGLKFDRLHTRPLEDGFVVERELQRGVNLDWAELHFGPLLYWRLDIPLPRSAGPGGPLRILGASTPIDERSSLVVLFRLRRSQGWQRALWRTLYRLVWEKRHWGVIEQDRSMLESQRGLESRYYEHHANADVGVIELRRWLIREFTRQQQVHRAAAARGRERLPDQAEAEEQPTA
jgi:phenylpropionate dioxygenase-like ring-hydroxylating dioxygenase large terminal subunit